MPDGQQYQQIRHRLQPRQRRGLWPQRGPDILPLPVPPDLQRSDLDAWAYCLFNVLPLPYQIVGLQIFRQLNPELLTPEQQAELNSPEEIVSSVIEQDVWDDRSATHATRIIENGILNGIPQNPTQEELYQRWAVLDRWWNTTLQRIPLLASGIRLDPSLPVAPYYY